MNAWPSLGSARTKSNRLTFLTLLVCLVSGCGHLGTNDRQSSLIVATETYRELFRWGNFGQAALYLKARDETLSTPDFPQMARFKISSYETSQVVQNSTFDEARLVAQIEYYELDSRVLRTLRDEQFWWFDKQTEKWFLGSPMPTFVKH